MVRPRSSRSPVEEFKQSVRRKVFSPLYFFWGEEDFLIEEAVDLIVTNALDESMKSFNLDILHGSDIDARDVASLATSFPAVGERRVVVVKEFDRLAEKELLIPTLGNPLPSTILVLIGERADARSKLMKALEEHAMVLEFRRLPDYRIPEWISRRVSDLGKEIAPEACELLHVHVGSSLRDIQNEIDKLFSYIGEKRVIEEEDVRTVVGMSKRFNIFELQRAVGDRNLPLAQEITDRMLEGGERATGVVSLLTRYLQRLWVTWDFIEGDLTREGLLEALHYSPRQAPFLDREIAVARSFGLLRLEECFSALAEADEALKSSTLGDKLVMTVLLHRIIGGRRND